MVKTHAGLSSVLRSPPADEGASGAPASLGAKLAPGEDRQPGDITIDRAGVWWHEGRPIARKELVKLFSSVLRREDDGGYALVTPVERCRVHVADAPFLAEEMEAREDGDDGPVLAFRSNVDQWVEAGPDHPIRVAREPDTGAPRPYILIKPGLEARIVRSVFYRLVELAEYASNNGSEVLGVWSRGTFFPLDPTGRT